MLRGPGLRLLTALALLGAASACSGMQAPSALPFGARAGIQVEGPGAVFQSVEAAALDALANAHLTAGLRDRRRLRVGTIHRVATGYSYSAPQRAAAASPLMPQSVRYRLRPIDVASYVIPPRRAQWPAERSNELPAEETRRIVDELDPAHRPLYLLTPSLDVVRYQHGERPSVLTRLNDHRRARCLAAAPTEKTTLARATAPCAAPGARPAARTGLSS